MNEYFKFPWHVYINSLALCQTVWYLTMLLVMAIYKLHGKWDYQVFHIGSGDGLVPSGTMQLPVPKLKYHQRDIIWVIL